MNKAFIILTLVFLVAACSSNRERLMEYMQSSGETVKQYKEGNDEYLIMKEGNRIKKYRVYDFKAGSQTGTRADVIYSVDTVIQTCATGEQNQTPIDCERLKKDTDMLEYITW